MIARKWPCLLSEKTPPSSLRRFCLSLRSTIEPSLTPMRIGSFFALQAWMTSFDLRAVGDVAGVEADLVNAGVDRFQRPLEMEVHVRDDRHGHLRQDFLQRSVLLLRHGDADEVGPAGGSRLISATQVSMS